MHNVKVINLPTDERNTLTQIAMYAFYYDYNLTNMFVPNSVTNISISSFAGCVRLQSMTLPFVGTCRGSTLSSASVFGYIFGQNPYMSDTDVVQEIQLVQYDEAGRELKLQATEQVFTNVPRNPGESTSVIYYIPAALNTVTIRSESHIGYGAFMNCSMLEHINLYSDKDFDSNGNIVMTVQEIGHYAFYGLSLIHISEPTRH